MSKIFESWKLVAVKAFDTLYCIVKFNILCLICLYYFRFVEECVGTSDWCTVVLCAFRVTIFKRILNLPLFAIATKRHCASFWWAFVSKALSQLTLLENIKWLSRRLFSRPTNMWWPRCRFGLWFFLLCPKIYFYVTIERHLVVSTREANSVFEVFGVGEHRHKAAEIPWESRFSDGLQRFAATGFYLRYLSALIYLIISKRT